MSTQNISDNKFHPVRYYVVEREDAQILISHAIVSWLGLVKILCTNKVAKCKRQVARKLKKPVQNNSHFRTSTPSQSEIPDRTTTPSQRETFSQKSKTVTKTTKSDEEPTSTSHSYERKWCRGKKLHREVDRSEEHPPARTSNTNSLPFREVQSGQSVLLAGPPHPPKVKYSNCFESSHFRTSIPSQSEISANIPKHLRAISGETKTPRR